MDASNSNLTDLGYGYDFVVSTTQASINSGLLEYLWESNQPINYICYLSVSIPKWKIMAKCHVGDL